MWNAGVKTRENVFVALRAIRGQLGRTVITVIIIAFGIMALVAFNTASEAVQLKVESEFSSMGANTFRIRSGQTQVFGAQGGVRAKRREPIKYLQARDFAREFEMDAMVSMSAFGSGSSVVKYESEKTNPNVQIIGGDENYLNLSGYELSAGRNFSTSDERLGSNVVVLGADVVKKIFADDPFPVNKVVSIGSYKYTVIGTLESKGASLGFSQDNQCLIPVSNLKKNFGSNATDYTVNVRIDDVKELDKAMDEATGLMAVIRGDHLANTKSFSVTKSGALAETLNDGISQVSVGFTAIGYLTLLGAAIGLMNIMLVSVTERTREIGVRKAIGASSKTVMRQFLMEAIVIGQIGGLAGTILGVLTGNAISLVLDTPFAVPWGWIATGVISCFLMSVVSGYFPARKAARLEPIDALRYE